MRVSALLGELDSYPQYQISDLFDPIHHACPSFSSFIVTLPFEFVMVRYVLLSLLRRAVCTLLDIAMWFGSFHTLYAFVVIYEMRRVIPLY